MLAMVVAGDAVTRDATSLHKEEEEACVLSMAGDSGAATRDATSQQ